MCQMQTTQTCFVLLQACVQQHAFIRPAVQQQEVTPHSLPSKSRANVPCLSDSHHGSGAAETDASCDDTESSSSSSSDNDSISGSDGAAYQPSVKRKHTTARGHSRRTGTAGQAVAPLPAAAAAAGTSSLTSDQGAASTQRRTRAHVLPEPQCAPPHLVRCQCLFQCTAIKIPSSLCTDIRTGFGVPLELSVMVHPARWSVKEYVLSQQPEPPQQPGSTTSAQVASAITATAAEAALTSNPPQQAGGNSTDDQAEAGSTVCLGPFTGFMKHSSKRGWVVGQLQHSLQLCRYVNPHQVVLVERVSSTYFSTPECEEAQR